MRDAGQNPLLLLAQACCYHRSNKEGKQSLVNVRELHNRTSEILRRAKDGKLVFLTQRGKTRRSFARSNRRRAGRFPSFLPSAVSQDHRKGCRRSEDGKDRSFGESSPRRPCRSFLLKPHERTFLLGRRKRKKVENLPPFRDQRERSSSREPKAVAGPKLRPPWLPSSPPGGLQRWEDCNESSDFCRRPD